MIFMLWQDWQDWQEKYFTWMLRDGRAMCIFKQEELFRKNIGNVFQ